MDGKPIDQQVHIAQLGIAVAGQAQPLCVPAGWHVLCRGTTAEVQLVPRADSPGSRCICLVHPGRIGRTSVLGVRLDAATGEPSIRLNGRPAGPIAVQMPGDEIRIAGLPAWRLVERTQARRFVAAGSDGNRACAICRTPLIPGRSALSCICGAVMHDDDAADSAVDDALTCANLSNSCPSCFGPLAREADWRPRLEGSR